MRSPCGPSSKQGLTRFPIPAQLRSYKCGVRRPHHCSAVSEPNPVISHAYVIPAWLITATDSVTQLDGWLPQKDYIVETVATTETRGIAGRRMRRVCTGTPTDTLRAHSGGPRMMPGLELRRDEQRVHGGQAVGHVAALHQRMFCMVS